MVKIAVISDLHLGFGKNTEREKDCYNQAAEAFNKALEKSPDIILLIGDIFHKKIPSQETLGRAITLFSEVNQQMEKKIKILESKGDRIKSKEKSPAIVTIYGTHERRSKGKVNPVHILEKAGLLYCLTKESILTQIRGEKIGIHGLSGVHDKFAKEKLKEWDPSPFEDSMNIFLIHQTFNDILPTGQEDFLEFKDLPSGFDLYLLGHIHWRIEEKHPSCNSPILLPGSVVRTQLRDIESKKGKGFYMIRTKQNQLRAKFIPIDTRPFVFKKIKVEGKKPSEILTILNEKLSSLLEKDYSQKPIIKIKLEGKLEEGFLPTDLKLKALKDKYKNRSLLKIDKSKLTSSELEERKGFLQEISKKNQSVDKIGLDLLSNSLGFSDPLLEDLFQALANGEEESAENIINEIEIK